MAFLIDRCTDYPYLSFKLRCVGNEKAIFDIVGKRELFRFEIHPGYAVLIDKEDPVFIFINFILGILTSYWEKNASRKLII